MQIQKSFIVHEWGTFLAIAGSDGVTLEGMSHEEHPLPDFVHSAQGESVFPKWPTLKGETPVIYFYTDKPRKVLVGVDFPTGEWTHWFPSAASAGRFSGAAPHTEGHLGWIAQIAPPVPTDSLPELAPDSLWRFARQVPAAATVTSNGETERFLFYRGLGKASLPVTLLPEKNGGRLVAHVTVQRVILLNIAQGKLTWRPVSNLKAGQTLDGVRGNLRPGTVEDVAQYLTQGLLQSGLFPDEARGLIETWRASYFEHEGFRVLFILPQTWTNRFIPLHVRPQPDQLVRVMVGRLEGLTKQREAKVAAAIKGFPQSPKKHFATLTDQGRYLEPILRRLAQAPALKPLCERFLRTEFVKTGKGDAQALAQQLRL